MCAVDPNAIREKVYRPFEQKAYPLHNTTERFYKNLPLANQNEYLIEKSPIYSRQFKNKFYKDCDKRATLKTASDIKVMKSKLAAFYNYLRKLILMLNCLSW